MFFFVHIFLFEIAHKSRTKTKEPASPLVPPEPMCDNINTVRDIVKKALKEIPHDDPLYVECKFEREGGEGEGRGEERGEESGGEGGEGEG
jgi:hypothetical protein